MIRNPRLPPAPEPPTAEQVVRVFGAFGTNSSATLIAAAGSASARGDGAQNPPPLEGPPGFTLRALRLERGTALSRLGADDDTRDAVLHLVEGEVEIHGHERSCDRLKAHDTIFIPGDRVARVGSELTVESVGRDACVLIEVRHAERAEFAGTPAKPIQIVRIGDVTAIRDRFPVRFAPQLNDILSPELLFPLVGAVTRGPGRFAIRGPDELVMVAATTSPGTGPALHVHTLSTEMFVVLRGHFRVSWGDAGERHAELGPLDAIVVPTGLSRAFEALDDDAWILPVVVGANDETEDIAWLPAVGKQLMQTGPWLAAFFATRTSLRIRERSPA